MFHVKHHHLLIMITNYSTLHDKAKSNNSDRHCFSKKLFLTKEQSQNNSHNLLRKSPYHVLSGSNINEREDNFHSNCKEIIQPSCLSMTPII